MIWISLFKEKIICGIFKRFMEFLENTQKILAFTYHYYFTYLWNFNCSDYWFSYCPVHLYNLLIEDICQMQY